MHAMPSMSNAPLICLPTAGTKPISLFIEEQSPRAWPGGVGSHKIASNYAPTIAPQASISTSRNCWIGVAAPFTPHCAR